MEDIHERYKHMAYIEIGKAVNTHGLKGELKIESWSDFDEIRYTPGNFVWLKRGKELIRLKVKSFRVHKGYSLVSFEELKDINEAEPFKNCVVYVDENDRQELPEGEYYFDELTGMDVYDEEGNYIGEVISVEETNGAQDNLRVQRDGKPDALIPNVPAFVKEVNMEENKITIHVIGGLL